MVTELTNVLIYIGLFLIMILVITFIAIIIELEKLDEEERLRDIIHKAKKKIYATWITTTADMNNDYFIESNLADMPEGIELLEILDEVDNEKY